MFNDGPNPETKNHKFWLEGEEVHSRPATKEEIQKARDSASEKDAAMRSCWQCNPAHKHFLSGDRGDWLLLCLWGCGNFYFDGIDITDHSGSED